jgi:hypothetical protein
MEAVIDFEYLRGRQNEIIVKELAVAGKNVSESFRFESPYTMTAHGSEENGLNWADGHIPYHKLFTVVSEAVANFAHLYSIGTTKCKLLSDLLGLPIHDLQDFNCPPPNSFKPKFGCSLPCHRFPDVSCATKSAHSLYTWLKFHLQTKSYVKCPKDMSRHTAEFISAVKK